MGTRLYVGNLAWTTTEGDLTSHFASHGTVKSARIIKDHTTGRSKGFGFVEMETEDQTQQALSSTDGTDLNGRPLRVSFAQDKAPRTGGDRGFGRSRDDSRSGFPRDRGF